ncbi:histidine kinase [Microbispora rosea subsp. aerata]|nr:sensor histidine kinase [Microbispora rosea]GGO25345.1 histidine kinase [Microbispora rosea subsp. aerata]GIH58128.1 histidine kinase [Microbispora rosea subsp. aerata]GLJ85270.1 histidine kinase [Microbispora rosea subsp. aerata]
MTPLRPTLTALARGAALAGLALLSLAAGLAMLTAVVLTFLLGLVIVFPPAVRLARAVTRWQRELAARWSGVRIDDPYRPAPPPPVPQADGWYRDGRTLYKRPTIPAFNQRWNWMSRDPATWRDFAFLLSAPVAGGLVVAAPPLAVAYGVARAAGGDPAIGAAVILLAAIGARWYAPWAVRVHGRVAAALLGPTEKARLAQRVSRLDAARTEVVDAQAAELRRIERDLHDGAQARLVAIGMTIGAAEQLLESDPQAARALLGKAREASATALQEIRRLVRGIHPPVLAERGLGDAVRALALDSPLRTHVTVDLPERASAPLESAAYFAVSELLANAARHGDATEAWVDVSAQGSALRVTVTDDGRGGADPERGTGLRGIERRLGAFDGVLAVNSPAGGPTTAVVELPRAFRAKPAPTTPWRYFGRLCWVLWPIALFPQGLIAMVFKLVDSPVKSWFLGLHVPEPFQWPVIVGMIALGGGLLAVALTTTVRGGQTEDGACG